MEVSVQIVQILPATQLQRRLPLQRLLLAGIKELIQVGDIAAQVPRPLLRCQRVGGAGNAVRLGKLPEMLHRPLLCQTDPLPVVLQYHHHIGLLKQAGHRGFQMFNPMSLIYNNQIPSRRDRIQIGGRHT